MDACWLLVPVKRLSDGKSRLAATLTTAERVDLIKAMVKRTITLAVDSGLFAGIIVVSEDSEARSLARGVGAIAIAEPVHGLNEAVDEARQFAIANGAMSVLVLPSDMPRLLLSDLSKLVQAAENGADVVLAPSHDGGTNALLMIPPDRIDLAFGPDSARRHLKLADKIGARSEIVTTPTLAFDLDRPKDLYRLASNHTDLIDPALAARLLPCPPHCVS